MNEDAFARRFYADRSELEALGIQLSVDKPVEALAEQENYSLPPGELPPAGDRVHRRRAGRPADGADACSTASSPTPSRCASRSSRSRGAARARCRRPSSARSRSASPPPPAATTSPSAWPRSRRRSSAARRSLRLLHDGPRRARRAQGRPLPAAVPGRPVLPRRPLARARRHPRLPPLAHPRQGRLRHEGRARLPAPRRASTRAPTRTAIDWQFGDPVGDRRGPDRRADRLAGRAPLRPLRRRFARPTTGGDRVSSPRTPTPRQLSSWVLGLGEHARLLGPAGAGRASSTSASSCCRAPHAASLELAAPVDARAGAEPADGSADDGNGRREAPRSAPSASPGSSRSRRS